MTFFTYYKIFKSLQFQVHQTFRCTTKAPNSLVTDHPLLSSTECFWRIDLYRCASRPTPTTVKTWVEMPIWYHYGRAVLFSSHYSSAAVTVAWKEPISRAIHASRSEWRIDASAILAHLLVFGISLRPCSVNTALTIVLLDSFGKTWKIARSIPKVHMPLVLIGPVLRVTNIKRSSSSRAHSLKQSSSDREYQQSSLACKYVSYEYNRERERKWTSRDGFPRRAELSSLSSELEGEVFIGEICYDRPGCNNYSINCPRLRTRTRVLIL